MSQRRSENELALAGVVLFAIGVATMSSLSLLPLYNSGQIFLVALIGGLLLGFGLLLILRSVTGRATVE